MMQVLSILIPVIALIIIYGIVIYVIYRKRKSGQKCWNCPVKATCHKNPNKVKEEMLEFINKDKKE